MLFPIMHKAWFVFCFQNMALLFLIYATESMFLICFILYPLKGDKGIRTTVNYAKYYSLLYTGIIFLYWWRVEMQKLLSAVWNVLLNGAFVSHSCLVQYFTSMKSMFMKELNIKIYITN